MSVSYFGRSEPDGRRLGSDLNLLGKWVQTFSTLTEPPRKYSLSQLSNPDQQTLFSDKPSEFRLKDGPNGTVKLETIAEVEAEMGRWDAFFKDMDPEVLELTQHPNFHKSHQQVHQLKLAVSEGTYGARTAHGLEQVKLGTGIDTTRFNRIEAHVLKAGQAPGMKWKTVSLDDVKPKTVPSLSANLSNITIENIKIDNEAFKIKVAKTVQESDTKSFANPRSASSAMSPTHGSETSVSSHSPRSSQDSSSPSSQTSSSAGTGQSPTPSRGADLLNYLKSTTTANLAVPSTRNPSSDPVKTTLKRPQPASGLISPSPVTTAVPAAGKLNLAKVQVHPDVPCYEFAYRFVQTEVVPEYWTTKAGKARYLAYKLESLKQEDLKLQKSPETSLVALGPVHIFIDLSNIIIGFYDSIKTKRGIPAQKRVKPPAFSFENFDTLLSRGRKTEKKVVAGSVGSHSRRPTYMTEAEQLKYEMNILQRVSKPASPVNRRKGKGDSATSDTSSDDYFVSPMKQGEQGVDELIHLKLLQSALDKPGGGTIVLATGDAAHAEYSDGFKKNIERVLNYGWNVELYGWSRNISSAWRDTAFAQQWGRRFRIIELDDYCEELFGLTIDSFNE
ncbi:hypothetical protein V8F06_003120 [Rhypophila decipiens]